MAKIVIRSLKEEDVEAVQELLSCFPETYPYTHVHGTKLGGIAWLFRYILENNDPFEAGSLVLEIRGTVIGHIAYLRDMDCYNGKVYKGCSLVVSKQHHRKGYGGRLVRHLEKELKKIGARSVWFQTEMRNLPYCRKLKFMQFGLFRNYWGPLQHRYMMGRYFLPAEKKR